MKKALALMLISSFTAFQFSPAVSWAVDSQLPGQTTNTGTSFTPTDLQSRESSSQNLINQQNSFIQIQSSSTPKPPSGGALAGWLQANQAANLTGLVVSHPDDPGFIYHEGIVQPWAIINQTTQAYTYDQALAGIVFLKQKNLAQAKKIFDFFYNEWQNAGSGFDGFWTVYNVDPSIWWKRYEWRKGMGENAWMALFALHYAKSAKTKEDKTRANELALAITRWISTLPHFEGAVAMGAENPGGSPNWGRIISTENNWDYYALLKQAQNLVKGAEKKFFETEFKNLKNWFKTKAFDKERGLFRRGGLFNPNAGTIEWDGLQSLDVNSWAIAAMGLEHFGSDFGIGPKKFIQNIGWTFGVQDDGTFGGDFFNAKGFDFSDGGNASLIGRQGVNWVEGTNQMILAYHLVGDYYKARGKYDVLDERYSRALAEHFTLRNNENGLWSSGFVSYPYADVPSLQIFFGTPSWVISPGRAVSSVAWVYFAMKRINPFQPGN